MVEEKTKYDLLVEVLNKMVEEEKLPKDIIDQCIAFAEENGTNVPGNKEKEPKDKEKQEKETTKQMVDAFMSDIQQ
ncbi:hypothetical protein P7H60_11340 [Vagococcus carniphilus]|uniref:hypothetical protein n=1 Tax=Vagococcus carniphilus TaxID=218144 RepID=UPI002890F2A7|nr:hypothetical protein [Vagococcus carniphilus]MDT2849735.1 hypothetical protein [Vagococcus carniphilus]